MKKIIRETLETVVIAALIALVIRMFVFEPYLVSGPSMEPTLFTADRLIVSKFSYRIGAPMRGDIVVFKYPRNPDKDFVKRVIALGGETIEVRLGRVYINGQPIEEDFMTRSAVSNYPETEVPTGSVFVLGDNRTNSEDSRFFGFVPLQNIKGKAVALYWPLNRIRSFRGG